MQGVFASPLVLLPLIFSVKVDMCWKKDFVLICKELAHLPWCLSEIWSLYIPMIRQQQALTFHHFPDSIFTYHVSVCLPISYSLICGSDIYIKEILHKAHEQTF